MEAFDVVIYSRRMRTGVMDLWLPFFNGLLESVVLSIGHTLTKTFILRVYCHRESVLLERTPVLQSLFKRWCKIWYQS